MDWRSVRVWSKWRSCFSKFVSKNCVTLFLVFTSHAIKTKNRTIQWKKSTTWDTIDDWCINNLAKNQVSAVFPSRVICKSVSPKITELCMETPCLCPSEGHKYGGRKVTETSVTACVLLLKWNIMALAIRHIEINASSSASTV